MAGILLVEDDRDVRALLAEEVGDVGEIVLADSGDDAIALLSGLSGLSAVVTDLRLGRGSDGFAVLRAALAHHPACVRVLVTAERLITLDHETSPLVEVVFRKPWIAGTIRGYLIERLRA